MSGIRTVGVVALLSIAAAGCGGYRQPLPLRPEPIAYDDTLPIAEPRPRGASERQILFGEAVLDRLLRPPIVRGSWEAANLTHFDDVVSSAWFVHRNAQRAMTPEEIGRGPAQAQPDGSSWTVVGGKTEGVTPGFTLLDARGDRYFIKFDAPGFQGLGTSAGVISNRLFHAAGYYVPEDFAVTIDSARLVVSERARIRVAGRQRPMTRDDVRAVLARTQPLPDGTFLALASKAVPGVPKGPFRFNGTRDDDPNDYYAHQYRRELRGLFVMAAWLNHVDLRLGNSLDAYVEPGYLRHYLIDFASSLGSSAGRAFQGPRAGQEGAFDLWKVVARFVTLGMYHAPWEVERYEIIHPSIGWMATESFRPDMWKPGWPNSALRTLTPADGYWGAKLVASFTDEQIAAAVGAAPLPEVAADTLIKILVFRRDKTVRHWFGEVAPIERVQVTADAPLTVEFEDLGVARGLWEGERTTYRWRLTHSALDVSWRGEATGGAGLRQRLELRDPVPAVGVASLLESKVLTEGDAIATLRIEAVRPDAGGRAALVYLRWDSEANRYRVAGLHH